MAANHWAMPSSGVVHSLHIYPVKALRGVSVDSVAVERRGFAHDRRWLVVHPDGAFMSQRDFPLMARLTAHVDHGGLKLTNSGLDPIFVPTPGSEHRKDVTVWGQNVSAADAGDLAAAWVTDKLGEPCRLVMMDDASYRGVDRTFGAEGDEVSFADGFPILVTSTSSLRFLNDQMEEPVLMNRFRPNLVIDGFDPWAEDGWLGLRIGDVALRVVKPCARCLVTTTDQETGRRLGSEPLRTLAACHAIDGKAIFGQNAIPDAFGTIRVGDSVVVFS